jgi:RNA polymerase sigma-70 factor, ECF subfamily
MGDETMTTAPSDTFTAELSTLIPRARAFAYCLCHNAAEADDVVQESLVRALRARESYTPGTNMRAWLFMIIRNHYFTSRRQAWRQSAMAPEETDLRGAQASAADSTLELDEVRRALARLPEGLRSALVLVGAGGMAYDEAAEILQVEIGTIKSRVSRARGQLARIMAEGTPFDGQRPTTAMSSIVEQFERLRGSHRGLGQAATNSL